MEHIRNFDWCMAAPDTEHFLTEAEIDNSCTEKILRNKYVDPLASSESEDEEERKKIDWDTVFKNSDNNAKSARIYVPGLRGVPPYPKLSALSKTQHWQLLKVVCSEYPNVLEAEFIPRPTKLDQRLYEDIKHIYLKEQKEYISWAKTLWSTTHCIRALRPKPQIEMVYDAEFKMKAAELDSLPKTYEMVAQLPLITPNTSCDIVHKKDLLKVNMSEVPQVNFSELFSHKVNIVRPSAVPEPCRKHPCRFILPSESSVSILPLTEVHNELAQYCLDNGARYIASESALRCLVQTDRAYTLPVTVCRALDGDGENQNVAVIGNEFSSNRETSLVRTYRAFRHLLLGTLITSEEKTRIQNIKKRADKSKKGEQKNDTSNANVETMEITDESDNEENNLFIDVDLPQEIKTEKKSEDDMLELESDIISLPTETPELTKVPEMFACTCQDTSYETPPPRSFRRWQVRSKAAGECFDLIVHCSHKIKSKSGDIVLEPVPEYQIDVGATEQSLETIKSLALSLLLRRNASVMNVRVDGRTGDLVTYENLHLADISKKHDNIIPELANIVCTTLNQLQGLMPGNYLLRHDTEHGPNVLLYVARKPQPGAECLTLTFDVTSLAEADESKCLKKPPVLSPVLLPAHKFRKILPLAFSPFPNHVAPEPKKPVTRQKTPPQAIKWPKTRQGKKKQKR